MNDTNRRIGKVVRISLGVAFTATALMGCGLEPGFGASVLKLYATSSRPADPAATPARASMPPVASAPPSIATPPSRWSDDERDDWSSIPHRPRNSKEADQKREYSPFPGHYPHPDLPPRAPLSNGCSSEDPDSICLGLKYVSYVGPQGHVESKRDAIRDVEEANRIWNRCGIQFQLDEYQDVDPNEFALRYQTSSYQELNDIRQTFHNSNELLVVATGLWDRSGNLGNSWANAWTNLPGERLYGVVLEDPASRYPQILAHELGHYLSLEHASGPSALMTPVVHTNSTELSLEECQTARSAAHAYWRKMFR